MTENKTFAGLLGLVNNGTARLSIAGISPSWDEIRYGNMDHPLPVFVHCLRFLTRPPRPYPGWMRTIHPWKWTVWFAVIGFLFLASFVLERFLEGIGFSDSLFFSTRLLAGQSHKSNIKCELESNPPHIHFLLLLDPDDIVLVQSYLFARHSSYAANTKDFGGTCESRS